MLDLIIQITQVNKKYWQEFSATTPGGIKFAGYICRQESEKLGLLAVTRLDGTERLAFIYAMPKIPYPYQRDRHGQPHLFIPLPQNAVEARFNVKLDGTCIIWYPLTDEAGEVLEVVPRTRLRPVLTRSRWGDWEALLKEAMPDQTPIHRAVREQKIVLCFELWGYRNPHLVSYDTPLTLTLHSGVRNKRLVSHRILADIARRYGLPLIESIAAVSLDEAGLARAYRELQAKMEAANRAAGEDRYVKEGAVLVISTPRTAIYYKCKPPSIEEVHWTVGQTISQEIIRQALFKMTENGYDFEAGRVEDLMAELEKDFERPRVEGQEELIRRAWVEYVVELQRQEWLRHLVEASGIAPRETVPLMRHLSQHYPKKEMRWVYNTVRTLYGLEE
jgi:hypothetical protein